MRRFAHLFVLALSLALCAATSFAQEGKLKVKVTPKQAYLFVDGQAIREGNQTISLSAGKHTVVVVNYGYKIHSEEVNIDAGKTTDVTVALEAYGGTVNGPFGDVMFKNGDRRAAVLSNGTTPSYFVGHVDEFDWDWLWHQNLLLPVGTHHITITRKGNTIWSGDVTVVAGKKVIVDIGKNGSQKTVNWDHGNKLPAQPRFKAGMASSTVAVAPVTVGSFTASANNINCGQSSTLSWSSN